MLNRGLNSFLKDSRTNWGIYSDYGGYGRGCRGVDFDLNAPNRLKSFFLDLKGIDKFDFS